MDPITKKLITLLLLGFSIGFVLALFLFPMQIHIYAVCRTTNEVMLSQYKTIMRDVDLRLTGCEDIDVTIRRPSTIEILFKKEPEIVNMRTGISGETGSSGGGGAGGGGDVGGGGGGGGVTYQQPSEGSIIINPIPTVLEIFDLCSPGKEVIESMKWCLNRKPPYDVSIEKNTDTITFDFMSGEKTESYTSTGHVIFMYLLIKDVKNIPEPYVIRMIGPHSDYFLIGDISKISTMTYEQLSEKVISVPIIFDASMSFPTTTGRSELQFYIETEEGHEPVGTVNFYFQS